MDRVGMIVYSFALRHIEEEPNPCNVRLAQAAERIRSNEPREVVVVAQWETARAMDGVDHVVSLPEDTDEYLGSDDVLAEAVPIFRKHNIAEVIPVAQPFLHLQSVRSDIDDAGFTPISRKIGWIGFDRQSTQWWTRDPLRLLLYAVLQVLFGYEGKPTTA